MVLHCPDLVDATRSVNTEKASPQDAVATMLAPAMTLGSVMERPPDLVAVTGNVAINARPQEYESAYALLAALRDLLRLDANRVVVIPGSNDVNRLKCEAHFLERAGSGDEPTPPYWEKWQPFATMIRRFHGAELPKDEPWLINEFPDLRVVVAGLNSTMAESHRPEDRYGYLGPEQIRWFADRLSAPDHRDWLRIGLLHHRPGGTGSEGLSDTEDFRQRLAPHLDVVLHGRAGHPRRLMLEPDRVPVLTGAAPGGWQLLELWPDHLRVRSDRELSSRVTAVRVAEREQARQRSEVVPAADSAVDTQVVPAGTGRDATSPAGDGDEPILLPHPPSRRRARTAISSPTRDRLTVAVAEICRLRYRNTHVTPVPWQGPGCTAYLRISPDHTHRSGQHSVAEQHPIGVSNTTPTRQSIQRFIDEVLNRFRASDATPDAKLVYSGEPADQALCDWAAGRGVEIVQFAEFQLGHELDGFAEQQAKALERDPIYPESLYVPQRYTNVGRDLAARDATGTQSDALAWLRNWTDLPKGRLVVVLGTFGHGKTFLLRQFTRWMRRERSHAVPILIDLRGFDKAHSLDELVAVQLSRRDQRQIDLDTFRYLRRAGRVVLLFDGFDELAARVSYDRATNHLDTIVQAAEGRAKVVVTSRDQHFQSDSDVLSLLDTQPGVTPRVIKLADFDERQIRRFLINRLGDRAAADARLDTLRDIKDLIGLSRNPRMLSFITELDEGRLRAATGVDATITPASLYREILDRWLTYEAGRLDRLGPAQPGPEDLLDAVTHLALKLWDSPEDSLGLNDLGEIAQIISRLSSTTIAETAALEPQEAAHVLGSSTLLVQHGEGRFAFVHHSVREWLIANYLAAGLVGRRSAKPDEGAEQPLLGHRMSPLLIDFLCGLAGPDTMRTWAEQILVSPTATHGLRRNAMEMLNHLTVPTSTPLRMAGFDLRGNNLSEWPMGSADLTDAVLADARLVGTDLTDARLARANLTGARLDRACLRRADLSAADLTGAKLLGADLTDAKLDDARLRRTALVGVTGLADHALQTADTLGAALPNAGPPQPQFGSGAVVHAIAVEPRTRLVAGGGEDGSVRVWDAGTGAQIRLLTGHTAAVRTVAYAPDGRRLASAGHDGTVRIWDTSTGQNLHTLTGHNGRIRTIAYNPDGGHLASAGHDGTVRIWDTSTGQNLHTLTGHNGWVSSLAYSPGGRHLASAGHDETVRIWDTTTGQNLHTLTGHNGTVHAVAYSPTHQVIASASDDRSIRIWNAETGQPLRTITGHTGWIRSVAYAPCGRHLASAGDDNTVRIWDTTTGQNLHTLTGHTGWIRSIGYQDSYHLASTGGDGTIRVWDTITGRQARLIDCDGGETRALCFSPDGSWLASGCHDGVIGVWDVAAGVRPRTLAGHEGAVTALASSPDGGRLATAGMDGTLRIWNLTSGKPLRTLPIRGGPVRSLAYSMDGNYLAGAAEDATIKLWNARNGAPLGNLSGHTGAVAAVAFSPDGTRLASAGNDGTVRLWNPATGRMVRTLIGHESPVSAVVFSPDGTRLVSADDEATIKIWAPGPGGPPTTLVGHVGAVTAVAFSPDGTRLASAGNDGTIRLWNSATGAPVAVLTGHGGWIRSLAYTPDGRHLASAGGHRAIRLWDASGGVPRASLVPLASGGSAVLFEDLGYTVEGTAYGEFWYVIGMCRFEPGDLDPHVPTLRAVPAGTRLW